MSGRTRPRKVIKEEGNEEDNKPSLPTSPNKKWDDAAIVQVKLMMLKNKTPAEISKALKMNPSTVARFMGKTIDPRRNQSALEKDAEKHAAWLARAKALLAAETSPELAGVETPPVASGSGSKKQGKKRGPVDDGTPEPEPERPSSRQSSTGSVKKLRFAAGTNDEPNNGKNKEKAKEVPAKAGGRKPRTTPFVRVPPRSTGRVILPPFASAHTPKTSSPLAGPSPKTTGTTPFIAAPAPEEEEEVAPAPALAGPSSARSMPSAYSSAFGNQSASVASPSSISRAGAVTPTPAPLVTPVSPPRAKSTSNSSSTKALTNGHRASAATNGAPSSPARATASTAVQTLADPVHPPHTPLATLLESLSTTFPALAPHLLAAGCTQQTLAALGRLTPDTAGRVVTDLVEWAEASGTASGVGDFVRSKGGVLGGVLGDVVMA
ncbi:hypothetical protein RQP46_004729 [Phenoliferia psychrophenolica]